MRPLVAEKHPSADLPFSVDFGDAYEDLLDDDALASGSVTADISGLSIGAVTVSGTKLVCRISGGTAGTVYRLTWIGTTAAGCDVAETMDMYVKTPSQLRRPSSVEAQSR